MDIGRALVKCLEELGPWEEMSNGVQNSAIVKLYDMSNKTAPQLRKRALLALKELLPVLRDREHITIGTRTFSVSEIKKKTEAEALPVKPGEIEEEFTAMLSRLHPGRFSQS